MKPELVEYKLRVVATTKSQTVRVTAAEARALLKALDALRLRVVLVEAGKGGRRA